MASFPCTSCGACCCNVSIVGPLLDLGWVGEDGVCTQYDREAKKCKVYDTRPYICNIDEGRPVTFSPEDWTAINLEACDALHLRMYGEAREQTGECRHTVKEQ